MKIKILSFQQAFEYMFWKEYKTEDKFALISIQESSKNSGIQFIPNDNCKDVLTLYFDDLCPKDALGLNDIKVMTLDDAKNIIKFIEEYKEVDYFVIHCHAGISRSSAVGKFILNYFNEESKWIDEAEYICVGRNIKKYLPNQYVYTLLMDTAS